MVMKVKCIDLKEDWHPDAKKLELGREYEFVRYTSTGIIVLIEGKESSSLYKWRFTEPYEDHAKNISELFEKKIQELRNQ